MNTELESLKDILVAQKLEAMKLFNKSKTNIINVILAEVSRKVDPLHPTTHVIMSNEYIAHTIKENNEIISVCKKMINSNIEILDAIDPTESEELDFKYKTILNENIYLEEFLKEYAPKMLTDNEIETIVNTYLTEHETAKIGDIMKYFKFNYNGKYDGQLLYQIVQCVLNKDYPIQ